jgi:predicted GNAT family acetyltransferase
MDYEIKHKQDASKGMFYMEDEKGIVSELDYTLRDNDIMSADSTKTRESLQGNGLASKILDHVVSYARENNIKIDPVCPFVEAKFDETESYQDVRV